MTKTTFLPFLLLGTGGDTRKDTITIMTLTYIFHSGFSMY